MAGHSLCGVKGCRETGVRREVQRGGGRGMKGKEVGEEGKERRTVV